MINKMVEGIEYDFECINYTEYELITRMECQKKLFNMIFTKSKEKLARTKGITVKGDLEKITTFEVIPQYLPLVRLAMKKPLAKIKGEISDDNIKILNTDISKGVFTKNNKGNWIIEIIFRGTYIDNR